MTLDALQYGLGALSGSAVGFSLGMFGGGGSILAVPLMVYVVGVPNAHIAIGTSAFAVAANAFANMLSHARLGNVKWRCAAIYSTAGLVGAYLGSSLGKVVNGKQLILFFALLMLLVAVLMFRRRGHGGDPSAQCNRQNAPKVLSAGGVTGAFSGFFGIGGGFLIVPGLMASTSMPIINAVGTSLVAITIFGLTTAVNYSVSGLVNWPLAFIFVLGGAVGGFIGTRIARHVATKSGMLTSMFAGLVFVVGIYMIYRSISI